MWTRENSAVFGSQESISSLNDYYLTGAQQQLPSTGSFADLIPSDENHSASLHYVESSAALAPITTRIRPSTALTEKIILEITKSIKIFKPSRSLYHLTNDRSPASSEGNESSRPTASIDVVISGKFPSPSQSVIALPHPLLSEVVA
jgi:hypothetical protein